jgi:TRAP-type C4-dicarboxylate transport system permease small subunit
MVSWQDRLPTPLETLSRVIDGLVALFGGGIIVISFGNAFLRFVMNLDVAWSIELSTFLMLWVTFLGCAAAAARGAHMRVTEITAYMLSAPARRRLEISINLAVSIVLVSIIWYGGRLSIRTWEQETTVLYWPVGLLYAAMPVGTLLTLVFIGHQTFCLVCSSESSQSHTE